MTTGRRILFCAVLIALLSARGGLESRSQDNPHGPLTIACDQCHTADSWKVEISKTQFDHAKTDFPLKGQHSAVPCRQCHGTLKFAGAPNECSACHADIHRGELGLVCERCHTPQSWLIPDMAQRHGQTRFPLLGAHLTAACESCHPNQQKHQYIGAPAECYACHRSDFQATLAPAHVPAGFSTDCVQCHLVSAVTWGSSFDHGRTGFPLTGAHAALACNACHRNNQFAGLPVDCYSCHQSDYAGATNPPHAGSAFPTTCQNCHTTTAWRPATLQHDIFFPISAGSTHSPGRWTSCSDCHTDPTNYAVFSCFRCHDKTRMDSEHSGVSNYSYSSAACYRCHPTGRGG